jgi:hypothetical protein
LPKLNFILFFCLDTKEAKSQGSIFFSLIFAIPATPASPRAVCLAGSLAERLPSASVAAIGKSYGKENRPRLSGSVYFAFTPLALCKSPPKKFYGSLDFMKFSYCSQNRIVHVKVNNLIL